MKSILTAAAIIGLGLVATGCTATTPAAPSPSAPATSAASTPAPTMSESAAPDIVDTAVAAGDFTTLATALEAADLVDTLKGEGPFTVFAPTDAAFDALPEGTLDDLLADPEALASVLTYHVVEGEVLAADLTDGQEVETVNGDTLTVSIDGDTVKINDATVTTADIQTSNGVIHVIDTVLVPPSA